MQVQMLVLNKLATKNKMVDMFSTEPRFGLQTVLRRMCASHMPTKMWICVIVVYLHSYLKRQTPGFSVGKVEEKFGIACSGTSELVYDNMALGTDNMMHVKDKGFAVAMSTLDGGRVGIAAQALGIAQRILDLAIAHAKQREQFGKPIATKQAIQWMIADMATKIEAARLLTWKAATIKDAEMAGTCELSRAEISRACSMANWLPVSVQTSVQIKHCKSTVVMVIVKNMKLNVCSAMRVSQHCMKEPLRFNEW